MDRDAMIEWARAYWRMLEDPAEVLYDLIRAQGRDDEALANPFTRDDALRAEDIAALERVMDAETDDLR